MPTPLVIGIGNEFRHDDAAGLAVARKVASMAGPRVLALEQTGAAADLIEAWRGRDAVAIVDASCGGGQPGTVHRFEFIDGKPSRDVYHPSWELAGPLLAASLLGSSHQFGVAEAIELGRTLGSLPRRLVVFAIEGQDYSMGEGLSRAVANSVDGVAGAVMLELEV